MIGFEPDDEQQLVIDTVHQFAEQEIRPLARPSEEARELPRALLETAHELGLVANALPAEFGGGGERSAVTGALVAEELAWGDLALALAILSPGLCALPRAEAGGANGEAALRPYLEGAFCPGALAWSETSLGFDPYHPETRAEATGDGFAISGVKCQVPWIEGLREVLVVASEGDAAGVYSVASDAPGLRTEPEAQMGIGALPTAVLHLDGAPAQRLDGVDLRRLLAQGRVGLAAMAVGVARAAFEVARDYAKEREAFGAPIATKQAIAFKLADMAIEIDGARLLAWEAAWQLDRGEDAGRAALLAREQARGSPSRWPTAPSRCSAATATSATTCPSCTCATRGASRASKP